MSKQEIALIMLVTAAWPALPSWGQEPRGGADIVVEANVAMKTRDGVTLRADIYHPAGEGRCPVLLQRTPYDKSSSALVARSGAARGYLVVVQDVRGRYKSDGEWYTFKHESEDGYDTVEWAAGLPNSNGKVGMFGGSYVGATQMLAAVAHPPHLAGICPVVTASNYHENWTYQGGAFEQWFNQSWTAGLAQNTLNREIVQATNALTASKALPLTAFPVFNLPTSLAPAKLTRELAPYYLDWLAHPEYDGYWKQWSIEEQYAAIQVPALTIAAWYDIFQGGSLRNYVGLREHAGNEAARQGQRLVVAMGGHSGWGRQIGDVDFGQAAVFDENAVMLDWYDYLFQGKQNEFASGKRARIFVMGENQWRDEDDWPLARAQRTQYFLGSRGKANTASGDGSLTLPQTRGAATDEFIYDPLDPVPTVGGPLCCDGEHLEPGARDQRQVEGRPDVLVYSTPALDRDVEVTGQITLDLFAKTTAVDTDFTAKLVDVGPGGFARNLTEGILRAKYRDGVVAAKPLVAGTIYEYKIDLWATSNVFLKGHKIRLEVSSSNFPRFDRNLNTGKSASDSEAAVKATSTIYHDTGHPSALVLPVIPE